MERVMLGHSGIAVSRIGFGAFKIGRNQKVKYAKGYDLPSDEESAALLNAVLDLGISLIDTAPAYGVSEERIGAGISHRRDEFALCTKVGERFEAGESSYHYDAAFVRESVESSLKRLRTDVLDIVLIHSNGDDLEIINNTDCVETLQALKHEGKVRAIGLSGKTPAGARAALNWADALMIEYHIDDTSHEAVMMDAQNAGVGVIVKKGLAAGALDADQAVRFVLDNHAVSSMVVGSLNLEHLKQNVAAASSSL